MRDLLAEMEEQEKTLPTFDRWKWFAPLTDADVDVIALKSWGEYPSGNANRRFALAILTEKWFVMPSSQARDFLRDWVMEIKLGGLRTRNER